MVGAKSELVTLIIGLLSALSVLKTKSQTLCFAVGVFVTTVFAPAVEAQVVLPRTAAYDEFIKTALAVRPDDPNVRPQVSQILEDTFVLFIPGALGSRLESTSGSPIWGKEISPKLESLKFSPTSSPARAKVLDAYPLGVTRLDVYGQFDSRISAAIGGTASREEFAYDWRDDIDRTVDRLEDQLRGEWAPRLKTKKLIIVAHSMGGVVAWHWKNKYLRKGNYDFTVSALILLGSPLQGSCEMLRMLLTGYRPNPNAGPLEEKLYKLLFSDLRPAAYTFPGIFQLLPRDDDLDAQKSCLVIKDPTGIYPQRHFAIDVWEKHLFAFLKGGFFEDSVWKQLGLGRDEFKKNLEQLLLKAREFRGGLDLSEEPLSDKIEYFYSNEYPTTSQVIVKGPGKLDEASGILEDGDGRVMKGSATNYGYYGLIPREISSSHGDLVKNRSFIQFIDFELKKKVQVRRVIDIAVILAGDAGATRSFGQSGWILSLSDLRVNPLVSHLLRPEIDAILKLNAATIEALNMRAENKPFRKPDTFLAAYEYARYLDDKEKKKNDALALYETVLASGAVEGSVSEAYALNRYAYALILSGDYAEALSALRSARTIIAKSPATYPKEFQGNVLNNIGVARWKAAGDMGRAKRDWAEAVMLGSSKAKYNLAIAGEGGVEGLAR